jgi:ATP-binding cassette subfamily B protein
MSADNTYESITEGKLAKNQHEGAYNSLNVIFLAVYGYICLEAVNGRYGLGTMVLLLQYAALIRMPIFSISFIVDQSQRAVANTRDYFAAMDEATESSATEHGGTLEVTRGQVKFTEVVFGYEVKQPVLRGLSFTLEPGTKTALVGESGEGKTTITNLLLGLYVPQNGSIAIDGQDISQVSRASLRAASSVVFQEPALFSGTIYENIAYGRPDASKAEVEAAARAANAHEFISKFEKGYKAEIGERGLKLSGGQKQRIAIARALLKDAPILILDEATSSLDSKSEHLVQEALERLMKGRTTLIIAHRLSTIQSVDTIITLKNGRLEEQGSPDELAQTSGIYAELLRLQQGHTSSAAKRLKRYELQA